VTIVAIIASSKGVVPVAAMSIRNLDERVMELLRMRAARHGRSMEAEVRAILVDAVREPDEGPNLAQAIMARFSELGGVELDLPPRDAAPRAVEFSDDNS
jgi:plasmid stability protein